MLGELHDLALNVTTEPPMPQDMPAPSTVTLQHETIHTSADELQHRRAFLLSDYPILDECAGQHTCNGAFLGFIEQHQMSPTC